MLSIQAGNTNERRLEALLFIVNMFVQSFTYYYYSVFLKFDKYVIMHYIFVVPEMVEAMKAIAKMDVELTVEERNLVSVGYKNVIGARRASWRILSSIEQKEESKGHEQNVKRIKTYRQRVEDELTKICSDILSVIDEHLVPSSTTGESTVFYYKM